MSLVPAFEIGFWNAWSLIIPILLVIMAVQLVMKKRNVPLEEEMIQSNRKEKVLSNIVAVATFASSVYSIFLPFEFDTVWFYVRVFVYVAGMIFTIVATINFAAAPKDEPATKGVYSISRNPMYFGAFLVYAGIGITCTSWIFVLFALAYIILQNTLAAFEEDFCLKLYGNAYQEYMDITPKWIGIPKSRKSS